jgi:hypothetical protein
MVVLVFAHSLLVGAEVPPVAAVPPMPGEPPAGSVLSEVSDAVVPPTPMSPPEAVVVDVEVSAKLVAPPVAKVPPAEVNPAAVVTVAPPVNEEVNC